MTGLNLHDIVRSAITFVNPDEDCLLYQADGEKNTLGVVKPVYLAPQSVKVQFQPMNSDRLQQAERTSDTNIDGQVFMYSDEALPVAGIQRLPSVRAGDFIYRDGQWYLIVSVIEDWNKRGWCNCGITLQVTPPDFSACEWYEKQKSPGPS